MTAGVAIAATLATSALGVRDATSARHEASLVTQVTVGMTEFHFALTRHTVRVGTVSFTVVNKGKMVHSFAIPSRGARTAVLPPGRRAVLRVTFKKPGRYYYLCAVGEHALYGMQGYLRVTR